jgi:hypothetical protein
LRKEDSPRTETHLVLQNVIELDKESRKGWGNDTDDVSDVRANRQAEEVTSNLVGSKYDRIVKRDGVERLRGATCAKL